MTKIIRAKGYKTNKNIWIRGDNKKSYVYIHENKKEIGILMWHYKKKRWVFEDEQPKPKLNRDT